MSVEISGSVKPGFESVADEFALGFEGRPAMGAALHICVEGISVVHIWAGLADARNSRAWTAATPSVIFSCTKGLVSILVARLVQDGKLSYQAPVATYWPEFAEAGKERVTVAQLMAHRAGLSALRQNLDHSDILEWSRVSALLAAQEPLWPPNSGHAYHSLTHGWLAGELVRRTTGMSVGQYFQKLIAEPLGVDAWIGLPATQKERVSFLQVSPEQAQNWKQEANLPKPNWSLDARTLGSAIPPEFVTDEGGFNDPAILAAEIPAANGIASARALATIWSATVAEARGSRVLDDEVIAVATVPQSEGQPVLGGSPPFPRWGIGFQLDSEARRFLGPHSFGHDGAGGQIGFADSTHKVGFGYVTNWMMGRGDTRGLRVVDALRAVLAAGYR